MWNKRREPKNGHARIFKHRPVSPSSTLIYLGSLNFVPQAFWSCPSGSCTCIFLLFNLKTNSYSENKQFILKNPQLIPLLLCISFNTFLFTIKHFSVWSFLSASSRVHPFLRSSAYAPSQRDSVHRVVRIDNWGHTNRIKQSFIHTLVEEADSPFHIGQQLTKQFL